MADSRYGRLFTETDVLDAIQGAYELGILGAKGGAKVGDGQFPGLFDVMAQHPFALAFPADEPLCLIRGRDSEEMVRRMDLWRSEQHPEP